MDFFEFNFFSLCVLIYTLYLPSHPVPRGVSFSFVVFVYSLLAFLKTFFGKIKKKLQVVSLLPWSLCRFSLRTFLHRLWAPLFFMGKDIGLMGVHNKSAVILDNRVISGLSHLMRESKQQNVVPFPD